LTRGFPRLTRTIIPALLALSLLVACRSGSATPTSTTSPASPSAPPGSPTRAAVGTPTLNRPNTPTPATPVVVTQTEAVVITPVDAGGLKANYRRVDSVVGNCIGPSLVTTARADAWQCVVGANNTLLDPCFAASTESQPALFCFRRPWEATVMLMVLNAPLPAGRPSTNDPTTPQPWGFELADGGRCMVVTETMPLIANQRVSANCLDSRKAIGDVDRSQPAWSILVVRDANSQPQRIQIVRAWY
jgi:hypothetical protein